MTYKSRRSRSSPGKVQSHSGSSSAGRFKSAIKHKRVDEEKRAQIHEVGDARRASVYRTNVEFAPEDPKPTLPKRGTPERARLLDEVVRLRRSGLSHQKIGVALDPMLSSSTVCKLLREVGEK